MCIHSERFFFSSNKLVSTGKSEDREVLGSLVSSPVNQFTTLNHHDGNSSKNQQRIFPIQSDCNSVTSKSQAPTTGMTIKCVTPSGEEGGGGREAGREEATTYRGRLGAVRGAEEKLNPARVLYLPNPRAQKLRRSVASGLEAGK